MDMYQKRKMRQEKKKNSNQNGSDKIQVNWYPGHMAKTKREIREKLNLIDVVYEVIDARMPLSSKIDDIDELIKNKKRILIMTKYDLCDEEATAEFIKYYEQKGYKVIPVDLISGKNVSAIINETKNLMQDEILKRKAKGLLERKTRVLVIGVPNAGKSTLINKLVGKNKAGVGNKPGFTKELSWIRVSKDIELLDSPGILWPKLENQEEAHVLAALSSIKEEVLDSFDISSFILKKLDELYPDRLYERYQIKNLSDDLIEEYDLIGKKRGALKRGGLVDYDKINNIIIQDLKNGHFGKITFDRLTDK